MGIVERKVRKDAKGKNIDSLAKSRQLRHEFVQKFGLVPTTILKHNRTDRAIDLLVDRRSYEEISHEKLKKEGITDRDMIRAFETGGRGVRAGSLSRFPQNIGRLLVKFYCPENGIVYDPFAGHNSRMQLTYETGRNYVGVDVSEEFMKANREIEKVLLKKPSLFERKNTITLIEGSSAKVDLPDDYADFTITSPPYWDLEYYGDESEQLGNTKTYDDFLDLLFEHVKENYRILRPGAFCCWCVNDFRKNKIFYPYHVDLIGLFEDAGFELFTIYITDLGVPVQSAFVQNIVKLRYFPKQHEYCLLFRKGGRL